MLVGNLVWAKVGVRATCAGGGWLCSARKCTGGSRPATSSQLPREAKNPTSQENTNQKQNTATDQFPNSCLERACVFPPTDTYAPYGHSTYGEMLAATCNLGHKIGSSWPSSAVIAKTYLICIAGSWLVHNS